MAPVAIVDAPMDLSIKNRRKVRLEEFLRQNLDQAPAGRVIQWVNREEGVFRILWTHQSSGAFTQQDAALFRYWALARGKPPNLSSVELKQSLRMALNKSPSVQRLNSTQDEYRYFRFTEWESRKSLSRGCQQRPRTPEEACRRRSSPTAIRPPPLLPFTQDKADLSSSSSEFSDRLTKPEQQPLAPSEPLALCWKGSKDMERPFEYHHQGIQERDAMTEDHLYSNSRLTKRKPLENSLFDTFSLKKTTRSGPPMSCYLEEHLGWGLWQEEHVSRNDFLATQALGSSTPRTPHFPSHHLSDTRQTHHHLSYLTPQAEMFRNPSHKMGTFSEDFFRCHTSERGSFGASHDFPVLGRNPLCTLN